MANVNKETDSSSYFEEYGGLLDRGTLSEDSAIGATWRIGEHIVEQAQERLGALSLDFNIGVVHEPSLNAVCTPIDGSYGAAIFWPLSLTIQGVAAALWANPIVAPWIGDISSLNKRTEFDGSIPPGFDLYLALQEKIDFEPAMFRSGIRIDDVEAISAAGEDRWDAFLVTWNSALRFVWGHELAHILYGHVDLVKKEFGISALYENEGASRKTCPEDLSQYMEFVADMDSAMHLFGPLYANFFSDEVDVTSSEYLNIGAATTLGILISIYVLWLEDALLNESASDYRSHPPIEHRASWILGAEVKVLDILMEQKTSVAHLTNKVDALRKAALRLLKTVGEAHESLGYWIQRLDDSAEASMNEYVEKMRKGSETFFNALDLVQKVRSRPR